MSSAHVGSDGVHAREEAHPSAHSLPSKLFFRIGEVASLVGVEPHVLRYWEREFRSIRPTKSAKGQRVYSRKDVENLLRVRDLLYRDGFTIAGAKKRLQRGGVEAATDVDGDERSGERERESPDSVAPHDDHDHEREREREEAHAAEPESGPRSHATGAARPTALQVAQTAPPSVRAKLTALRAEVEAFLDELESVRSERA